MNGWPWLLIGWTLASTCAQAQSWTSLGGAPQAPARWQVVRHTATELHLVVELPGFLLGETTLADGRRYHVVRDAAGAQRPVGHPDVPSFAQWILAPNGCEVHVEAIPSRPQSFPDIHLAPVQPPPDDSGGPPPAFARADDLFERNADYPGVFADFDVATEIRGQAARLLRLYPFQYNPRTRELRAFSRLEVRIRFAGTPVPRDPRLANPSFDRVLAVAPNARSVRDAEDAAPRPTAAPRGGAAGGELLIICPDAFTNAANELAAWKRRRGIATAIATTNETGSSTNEIRDYVRTAYSTWSPAPAYVLLLGDSDFIPPWYLTDHPAGLRKNATDLFYADMSEPFDRIPDLALGRWPVETTTQALNWAERTIAYESAPPDPAAHGGFYTNATLCASFQSYTGTTYYGYSERRFVKTTEDLRDYLDATGYNARRIYAEYRGTNPTHWANWYTEYDAIFENDNWPLGGQALPAELLKPAFPWSGARTDIRAAVNAGTFLLTHRDHGSKAGWSTPPFSRTTDVDILTNEALRPVVFSINCQTGWFDNETDDAAAGTADDSECFAEHWVRHPTGGAIGVVAPTRTSYSYHNDRLYWGLADAIWTNFLSYHGVSYAGGAPSFRMGDVLNRARTYYLTKYSLADVYAQCTMEIFHWLGDPTLEMWTAPPQELDVAHTGRVWAGTGVLTVQVAQAGAIVCCMYSNAIIGLAESAGGATEIALDPPPEGDGDLWITVTRHNYLPHLGTATVARVDGDEDGLPDWWEEHYFSSGAADPDEDVDEDGLSNFAEYVSGGDPTDPDSAFAAGFGATPASGECVLQWFSATSRFYSVYRATNLLGSFLSLTSGLPATPPLNVYTDSLPAGPGSRFYHLKVATNAPP